MATFQSMAAMMKSMKPEDMVTVISMVQSGKLKLQDTGGPSRAAGTSMGMTSAQAQQQLDTEAMLRQLQQGTIKANIPGQQGAQQQRAQQQVIDYSHGTPPKSQPVIDYSHRTLPKSQPQQGASGNEAEIRRLARVLGGESSQGGRGHLEDDQSLQDKQLLFQLRQRVMSGNADSQTVEMLARLGGELRAREEQPKREQAGPSAGVLFPTSSLAQHDVKGLGSSSGAQPTPLLGLPNAGQLVQDQQQQNLAQHQAMLLQQQYAGAGVRDGVPIAPQSTAGPSVQMQLQSPLGVQDQSRVSALQAVAGVQSGVGQVGITGMLHQERDILASVASQQQGAMFQPGQTAQQQMQRQVQLERLLTLQQQGQLGEQQQLQLQQLVQQHQREQLLTQQQSQQQNQQQAQQEDELLQLLQLKQQGKLQGQQLFRLNQLLQQIQEGQLQKQQQAQHERQQKEELLQLLSMKQQGLALQEHQQAQLNRLLQQQQQEYLLPGQGQLQNQQQAQLLRQPEDLEQLLHLKQQGQLQEHQQAQLTQLLQQQQEAQLLAQQQSQLQNPQQAQLQQQLQLQEWQAVELEGLLKLQQRGQLQQHQQAQLAHILNQRQLLGQQQSQAQAQMREQQQAQFQRQQLMRQEHAQSQILEQQQRLIQQEELLSPDRMAAGREPSYDGRRSPQSGDHESRSRTRWNEDRREDRRSPPMSLAEREIRSQERRDSRSSSLSDGRESRSQKRRNEEPMSLAELEIRNQKRQSEEDSRGGEPSSKRRKEEKDESLTKREILHKSLDSDRKRQIDEELRRLGVKKLDSDRKRQIDEELTRLGVKKLDPDRKRQIDEELRRLGVKKLDPDRKRQIDEELRRLGVKKLDPDRKRQIDEELRRLGVKIGKSPPDKGNKQSEDEKRKRQLDEELKNLGVETKKSKRSGLYGPKYFLGGLNTVPRSDLEAYFGKFGPGVHVEIAAGKGFGFLKYAKLNEAEVEAARDQQMLRKHQVKGREITCERAIKDTKPGEVKYFLGGFDKRFVPIQDAEDYFKQFGPNPRIEGLTSKAIGYLRFATRSEADVVAAREKLLLGTHSIKGTNVTCGKAKNKKDVHSDAKPSQQAASAPVEAVPLKVRVEKGLDVKIQTMRESKTPIEVINALETNMATLVRKQEDVDKVKETPMYKAYAKAIPRMLREKNHPQTPDMYRKCKPLFWTYQVTKWKESLQKFDPNDPHKVKPTSSTQNQAATSKDDMKGDKSASVKEPSGDSKVKTTGLKDSTGDSKAKTRWDKSASVKESSGDNKAKTSVDKSAGVKEPSGASKVKTKGDKSEESKVSTQKAKSAGVKSQEPHTQKGELTQIALSLGFDAKRVAKSDFSCSHCKYVGKSLQQLQSHSREVHSCHGPLVPCPLCKKQLASKFLDCHLFTKAHLEKQKVKQSLKCPPCSVSLKLKDYNNFQSHLESNRHKQNLQKVHNCFVCGVKLKEKQSSAHLKSPTHKRNVDELFCTVFVCKKCGRECKDMSAMQGHRKKCGQKAVEKAEKAGLTCAECYPDGKVVFSSHKEQQKHMMSYLHVKNTQPVEEKTQEEYHCQKCDFRSGDMKGYTSHLHSKEHDKNKNMRTYICTPCRYRSTSRINFDDHLKQRSHRAKAVKGEKEAKEFRCKKCRIEECTFDGYEKHCLSIQHIGTSFVCELCEEDCKTYKKYIEHQDSEKHKQKKKGGYKCQQCQESFPNREQLSGHLKGGYHDLVTRIREKKVRVDQCDVCNIKFDGDLKSFSGHIQDGEHILITKISGELTCLLCAWRPSGTTGTDFAREYWTHLRKAEHFSHLERLSLNFAIVQNIFRDSEEKRCVGCKKALSPNHTCRRRKEGDPEKLCTIAVEEDLTRHSHSEKVLKAYFRQFGEIVSAKSVVEKSRLRRTSIVYKRVDAVFDVLDMSRDHNGLTIQGNELRVKQSLPPKLATADLSSTLFMNVVNFRRLELFNYFSVYGKIKQLTMTSDSLNHFAYVEYWDSKDMMAAFERGEVANGKSTHSILDKQVVCFTMVKSNESKVLVKDIPSKLSHNNLESYFSSRYQHFNKLLLVRDVYSPKSMGFGTAKFSFKRGVDSVLEDGTMHTHMGKKFQCVPVLDDRDKSSESSEVMVIDEWFEGILDTTEDSELKAPGVDSELKAPGVDDNDEDDLAIGDGKETTTSDTGEVTVVMQKSKWEEEEEQDVDVMGDDDGAADFESFMSGEGMVVDEVGEVDDLGAVGPVSEDVKDVTKVAEEKKSSTKVSQVSSESTTPTMDKLSHKKEDDQSNKELSTTSKEDLSNKELATPSEEDRSNKELATSSKEDRTSKESPAPSKEDQSSKALPATNKDEPVKKVPTTSKDDKPIKELATTSNVDKLSKESSSDVNQESPNVAKPVKDSTSGGNQGSGRRSFSSSSKDRSRVVPPAPAVVSLKVNPLNGAEGQSAIIPEVIASSSSKAGPQSTKSSATFKVPQMLPPGKGKTTSGPKLAGGYAHQLATARQIAVDKANTLAIDRKIGNETPVQAAIEKAKQLATMRPPGTVEVLRVSGVKPKEEKMTKKLATDGESTLEKAKQLITERKTRSTSTVESAKKEKSLIVCYTIQGQLPTRGIVAVREYFEKLGAGVVLKVYSRKRWIQFANVGTEEAKKLTGTSHSIEGWNIKLVPTKKDPIGRSSASIDIDKDEFSEKIPDILARNMDWRGSSRGIEYVTAGLRCTVCQWFYKVPKSKSAEQGRKDHMNSEIHANQDQPLSADCCIYIQGIASLEISKIKSYFSKYGVVKQARKADKGSGTLGYGFVQFASSKHAEAAFKDGMKASGGTFVTHVIESPGSGPAKQVIVRYEDPRKEWELKEMMQESKNDEKNLPETDYGEVGVWCKVCNEFVKSQGTESALDLAHDHSSLLKHHLYVKLYILKNKLRQPKWLQNPLYSEGKKRKFTEGGPSKRTQSSAGKQAGPQGHKAPEETQSAGKQETPQGLNIVDYGSSDEEEDMVTDDMWMDELEDEEEEVMKEEEGGEIEMIEHVYTYGQPPPPGME